MLGGLKNALWGTADKLRFGIAAADYKHLVLVLTFLKHISDTFTARRVELTARQQNRNDEFNLPDAAPEVLEVKQPYIGSSIDYALALSEAERRQANIGQVRNFAALRDTLLLRLVSGKNPFYEAEAVVEEALQ